jgi:hypothetical protein
MQKPSARRKEEAMTPKEFFELAKKNRADRDVLD